MRHTVSDYIHLIAFSRIPQLRSLIFTHATSRTVLKCLMPLPNLQALDVWYLGDYQSFDDLSAPPARLQELAIRTDESPDNGLWKWIERLVPYPNTLEHLKICNSPDPELGTLPTVPLTFLRTLAKLHSATLRHVVLDGLELPIESFKLVCDSFPVLESLECGVHSKDIVRPGMPMTSVV
jgi:hypothetical protein